MIHVDARDFAETLIARKRELGLLDIRLEPNPGIRRTESKRRLLQAIEDNAHAQGRAPRFPAHYERLGED
jgi:hypothetical protein